MNHCVKCLVGTYIKFQSQGTVEAFRNIFDRDLVRQRTVATYMYTVLFINFSLCKNSLPLLEALSLVRITMDKDDMILIFSRHMKCFSEYSNEDKIFLHEYNITTFALLYTCTLNPFLSVF